MRYAFKNGITVIIPSDLPKEETIERWADIQWKMSVLLDPPPAVEPLKVRRPYRFISRKPKAKTKK